MREIIIATKNKGKAKEFAALFQPYGITIKTLLDLEENLPAIEETGKTFHENARLKAEGISAILQKVVIADDSGLEVNALDGRPGVYSARYAGEPTDDQQNNTKLLTELEHVSENERSAHFTCVLAISIPKDKTIYADGRCLGHIAMTPSGNHGFGYDPLFVPEGYSQTMAELEADEKNQISHRYHALKNLEEILQQTGLLGDKHA